LLNRSGTGELEQDLAASVNFFLVVGTPAALSIAGEFVALLLSVSFLRGMDFPALMPWELFGDPSTDRLGGSSFGLPEVLDLSKEILTCATDTL